ncbi:hypothetical protein YC2023_037092 [Brassica napus]
MVINIAKDLEIFMAEKQFEYRYATENELEEMKQREFTGWMFTYKAVVHVEDEPVIGEFHQDPDSDSSADDDSETDYH